MNPLSTMYTMHGAGRKPETRTEKILALQAARDSAIEAFRVDPEPKGDVYLANDSLSALKALGPIRSVWRPVFEKVALRLKDHAYHVNASGRVACMKAAEQVEAALAVLDSLMDELLAEHGI